jgi:hypothetical protein
MAKINFKKQPLLNLNGEQMKRVELDENKQEKRYSLTLEDVVEMNLNKEDATCTPTERFNRFLLSEKIKKADGDVDLSVEELGMIKKIMGEHPNPLILGRVWQFIEAELGEKK